MSKIFEIYTCQDQMFEINTCPRCHVIDQTAKSKKWQIEYCPFNKICQFRNLEIRNTLQFPFAWFSKQIDKYNFSNSKSSEIDKFCSKLGNEVKFASFSLLLMVNMPLRTSEKPNI